MPFVLTCIYKPGALDKVNVPLMKQKTEASPTRAEISAGSVR